MATPGANNIPERLTNFRVYNEAEDLLGITDIELPELVYMTDEIQGAGLAGKVDSPVIGHFDSMSTTLNWRTIEKKATQLMDMKAHLITARGAQQNYNASDGTWKTVPVRLVIKVMPKNLNFGKFEVGATTDTSTEFEVVYLKTFIDNKEVLEIDKFNYICKINGKDVLGPVRAAMGVS
jgi:P2 family phage contractile tail tube protein